MKPALYSYVGGGTVTNDVDWRLKLGNGDIGGMDVEPRGDSFVLGGAVVAMMRK